ncbi:MAG: hypothetical protein ABR950_05160 [Candidatus Dormibacteria bacterium]
MAPRALPTADADGQEVVLKPPPEPPLEPLEVEEAAEELEPVDAPEDDEPGVELLPQAASAATAMSPVRSEGRVIRWDMD